MDKIFIYGLQLECRIGIYPEELTTKQPLLLDLEIAINSEVAAASDDIKDTIDYDLLRQRVGEWVEQSNFNLLETLGDFIATQIIEQFAATGLRLRIHKLNTLALGVEMGIELVRGVIS